METPSDFQKASMKISSYPLEISDPQSKSVTSEENNGSFGASRTSRNSDQNPPLFDADLKTKKRVKTTLRQRYEAEAEVIARKLGSLERIRLDLGLSQRKMCELLLVDPSAWTRWLKEPKKVPPHIYRSLQWYLALIDKQPEWHPQNSFSGAAKILNDRQLFELSQKMKKDWQAEGLLSRSWTALEEHKDEWLRQKKELEQKLEKQEQLTAGWKLLLLLNTVLLIGFVILSF